MFSNNRGVFMKIQKAGTKVIIAHTLSIPNEKAAYTSFEKKLLSFYEVTKETRRTATEWKPFFGFEGKYAADRFLHGEISVPVKVRKEMKEFWKSKKIPTNLLSPESVEEINKLTS